MIKPCSVIQELHHIFPLRPLFQCHVVGPSGMFINHSFRIRNPEHPPKLELSHLLRPGKPRRAHQDAHKCAESKSQTRLSIKRTPAAKSTETPTNIPSQTFSNRQQWQDPVYALINVLYTQTLTEDQIEDSRENATSPKSSAAMAAPTSKGTAILLIVTDFVCPTRLITIPQPLLPSSLKLPSQKPRIAFHVLVTFFL